MQGKFELKRTIQCAKCPWKVSTNPNEIPDGYSVEKHKKLGETIAKDVMTSFGKPLRIMACHHSKDTEENAEHCIGWLKNQLGRGNNIGLRISMMGCTNIREVKTIGEQHKYFEDTLPKNKIGDTENLSE